jgi:hypothetical protein
VFLKRSVHAILLIPSLVMRADTHHRLPGIPGAFSFRLRYRASKQATHTLHGRRGAAQVLVKDAPDSCGRPLDSGRSSIPREPGCSLQSLPTATPCGRSPCGARGPTAVRPPVSMLSYVNYSVHPLRASSDPCRRIAAVVEDPLHLLASMGGKLDAPSLVFETQRVPHHRVHQLDYFLERPTKSSG